MTSLLLPRLCLGLLLAVATAVLPGCLLDPGPERKIEFDYDRKLLSLPPEGYALAIAAEMGDAAEIRRLMKDEGVDPDGMFSPDGFPLLAWPIYTRNPAGLKAMLENGADPNAAVLHPLQHTERFKGRIRNNAMVWAAKAEDPIYLRLLLDHGGNPNTRNSNGETLLHQAFIWQNQWENVKLLVERGADVNAWSGITTILEDYAAGGGFMQAYWLLEHGADPTLKFLHNPANSSKSIIIDSIYWHPGNPKDPTWQRRCQQWLLKHGYERPPMPEHFRRMRKNLGFPYEEQDIPLL